MYCLVYITNKGPVTVLLNKNVDFSRHVNCSLEVQKSHLGGQTTVRPPYSPWHWTMIEPPFDCETILMIHFRDFWSQVGTVKIVYWKSEMCCAQNGVRNHKNCTLCGLALWTSQSNAIDLVYLQANHHPRQFWVILQRPHLGTVEFQFQETSSVHLSRRGVWHLRGKTSVYHAHGAPEYLWNNKAWKLEKKLMIRFWENSTLLTTFFWWFHYEDVYGNCPRYRPFGNFVDPLSRVYTPSDLFPMGV